MTMQRFVGSVEELGERECGVICATDELARDGHILEPGGISLTNFKQNPIVLWQHIPEEPLGVCTAIAVEGRALAARVEFAPVGASIRADEICALVKAGVVRGVSIGFDPIEAVPLDSAKGSRGGLRITQSELLEISFCSVPVDTGAKVVSRGFASRPGAMAMLRSLPALSSAAIQRALDHVGRPTGRARPFGLLSPQEQMAAYQRARSAHCNTVWGLQRIEGEKEQRYSCEQRRADIERLQAIGESYTARRH